MERIKRLVLFVVFLFLAPAVYAANEPLVLYTDLQSGPNHGGENDKGVYLRIFGEHFGDPAGLGTTTRVFIGDVEVDNYRSLGISRGRSDIEQITVQIGSLGEPTPGIPLPIRVDVGGLSSNTDQTFIVQPGNILFVDNVYGNDFTAVKNDITRPWRYVQTPLLGGALSPFVISPGDIVVMRGHGVPWSDIGYGNRFARFYGVTGTAPTGVPGTGPLTIISYPGEDVHILPQPNTEGGIHGVDRTAFPNYSRWITIADLRIEGGDSTVSDGPINLQVKAEDWRIVNNELFDWFASVNARSGGISGDGTNIGILGNHVHNIGGGTLNHCVYAGDASTNWEIAYNHVHDCTGGNIIQTFGTFPISNIAIHHNRLHDTTRYGLNLSNGTQSVTAWNNIIYDTDFAGVRFSVAGEGLDIGVFFNTIYNTNRTTGGDARAPIINSWNFTTGTGLVEQNIVYPSSNAVNYFVPYGPATAIHFERNLWYGLNLGYALYLDTDPVGGDTDLNPPEFTDATAGDFSLQSNSPAIDQATLALPISVSNDFVFTMRPQGNASDVGAYEFVGATAPPAPTLSFSSNPGLVERGGSSTLIWSSTDATSCVASGDWSGPKPASGSETITNITAAMIFTLTCSGPGGSVSRTARVFVTMPPTLTLSSNPGLVERGGSSILTWSSTNATTCVASGDWSGAKPPSGNETISNITAAMTFTLTCSGPGGSVSATTRVFVTIPPTLTLGATPGLVARGGSSTLSWSSTNATTCVASGDWSGIKPTSGNETIMNITAARTFTLTCSGSGGSIAKTVKVFVAAPPTLSLNSDPGLVQRGGSSTLSWLSANTMDCVASGDWSGPKPTAGSETINGITAAMSFTLTCGGPGGSISRTANVFVQF